MKRKIAIGIGVLLIIILFAGIWGMGIEPRLLLDQKPIEANIPILPSSWEGRKAAVLGDFQVGLWWDNDGMVEKGVQAAIDANPAFVMIAGDFIYHSAKDPEKEIARVVDILRPLVEADLPVYAVMGNHDYAMKTKNGTPNFERAEKIRKALESIGIDVLVNDAVILAPGEKGNGTEKNSNPLYLVGIGAWWPEVADVDLALSKVPDDMPRLVMTHHPDSFSRFPAQAAPFAVAGHTHGGQVALPFTPEWTWMSYYSSDEVHADGWIDGFGEPGNQLYVNRGIGCSIAPIRINAPPELTLITLRRAE